MTADGSETDRRAVLIELQAVTKVYGQGRAAVHALRGVDLRIREGEFVAMMGPSGSGKSTCMNILGCLDTPTGGACRFKDAEVGGLSRSQRALLRRHYIGFVFQGYNLLARTSALENVPTFLSSKQTFLPSMDDGRIRVDVVADPGIALDEMDRDVQRLEAMFRAQPEVDSVFSLVGGRIFGRTQRETSNRSTLTVQLKPLGERRASSAEWVRRMRKAIAEAQLAGVRVRGLRVGRGEEDISLRITGPELAGLDELGHEVVRRLRGAPGVRNIEHSSEESLHELAVSVDRERAAAVGLTIEQVCEAVRVALDGIVVTDYIDGDRAYDVRLPRERLDTVQRLEGLLIAPGDGAGRPIHLADVAGVQLVRSPVEILRQRGQALTEAIVGAARLRLRPILMTTLTTVVGLLPLALGLGEGAEMLQPLAVTIVFGVLFSMLASLALVPVLYLRIPHARGLQAAGDGVIARS
ncbi:MAG: ATP-binding cassette domain-containing protein [Gammaproteobacteria bacterium]|nr:ATP-binding cassette domain-containing protein [Gammaproteobacteria bacterium]NIR97694.1 ATP-binding cassette domain-containing protein [Gammaproteobacteria bacterium]NIT62887.1 ATP-binding cassette domain-containing protein [Gammaproteobacteria bacterium]NIV19852.1 ATP-binding cassette domain-containing protein [Gammaproteobacteria bacterium]NIX11365.1 ATP-binding cassette domain-containing protein [Gammaproteobacteria bacterium]